MWFGCLRIVNKKNEHKFMKLEEFLKSVFKKIKRIKYWLYVVRISLDI